VALETSLFDALGEWMSYATYYSLGGSAPRRTGASHATIAPYGPSKTGDGKIVYLGLQNEREWKRFCEAVLHKPELATDFRYDSNAKRVQNREQLDTDIQQVFQKLTAAEIIARLEAGHIANARMNTIQEFVDHPQLKARNRWATVGSPVGPLLALLPPVKIENMDPVMKEVPAVGQHTDAILEEIGFDSNTIASWRQTGVI
jgi:itaconate CoA-transferase